VQNNDEKMPQATHYKNVGPQKDNKFWSTELNGAVKFRYQMQFL